MQIYIEILIDFGGQGACLMTLLEMNRVCLNMKKVICG